MLRSFASRRRRMCSPSASRAGSGASGTLRPEQSGVYRTMNSCAAVYDTRGNVMSTVQDLTAAGAKATMTYHHDDTTHPGDVTSVEPATGGTITYQRDSNGDVTGVEDALGGVTTSDYNTAGELTATTSPRGNKPGAVASDYTTMITRNAAGQPVTVTDPLGKVTSTGYNDNGEPVTTTTAAGTSTVTRDLAGRVTAATDAEQHTSHIAYTDDGQVSQTVTATGAVTSHTYDSHGWLKTTTSPNGNAAGTSAADKTARTVTFTHDTAGNVTGTSTPNPNGGNALTTSVTLDENDQPVATTNALGFTSHTAYDDNNQPVTVTDPLGNAQHVTYDLGGRAVSSTNGLGKTRTTTYAPDGLPLTATDELGRTQQMVYDLNRQMTASVDPRGTAAGAIPADYTTTFGFDADGDQTTVTDPLGNTTETEFDALGQPTKVTDANEHEQAVTYDSAGRVSTSTAADGGVTTYQYSNTGLLVEKTDANQHETTYQRDDSGRVTATVEPGGRTTTGQYDPDGNLVSVVKPSGTITRGYDALDRLTAVSYSDNTPGVTYGYDAASKVTSMTDSGGTQTFAYDAASRLTGSHRTGTVSNGPGYTYQYDAAGNITSRSQPDGVALDYTLDDANEVTGITKAGVTSAFTYDQAGNLIGSAQPNGAGETYTVNADNEVAQVQHQTATGTLDTRDYRYDPAGNLTGSKVTRGPTVTDRSYTYDPADRLLAECPTTTGCTPTAADYAYTYDHVGNRLTTKTPTGTSTLTYSNTNQVVGGTYDADGNNQGSPTGQAYNYNLAGQIKSTTSTGSNPVTTNYRYDGTGNRLTATTGTAMTVYNWDQNNPLPLLTSEKTGSQAKSYTYGPDGTPLTLTADGSDFTYLHDPLGTVTDVLTDTGDRAASYDYDPFGGPRAPPTPDAATAPSNPLKFTGQYRDPDGTYNLRARQYDPAAGTFTSLDPADGTLDTTPGSLYGYVSNNPLSQTDPSGLGRCLFFGLHRSDDSCALGGIGSDIASSTSNTFIAIGNGASGGLTENLAELLSPGASCTYDHNSMQYKAAYGLGLVGGLFAGSGAGASAKAGAVETRLVATEVQETGRFNDLRVVTEEQAAKAKAAQEANPAKPRYSRPSGSTTAQQRAAQQGKSCVDCGSSQGVMRADHIDPLVQEHYLNPDGIDATKMRSLDAVQPQCAACSNQQGGALRSWSMTMRKILDL